MSIQDAPALLDPVLGWLRDRLEDPAIGPEDNFLEVGGHSLMAIQLNTWLATDHGRVVDPAALFEGSLRDAVGAAGPADRSTG
jgi:phosphopantetheine binding protein